MRKFIILLTAALCTLAVQAQNDTKPRRYIDATTLTIMNKGWKDTDGPYRRLPTWLKDSVRETLWERSHNSSGIAVRFATNSSEVGVRYKLLNNFHMLHMADTGTKGTDLYVLDGDSIWRHANTNRPRVNNNDDKICEATYMSNLDTTRMTEYMIYLPLYDGVEQLEVRIDSTATIRPGSPELFAGKKIVGYGTSILHGGCASRTGMAATNILSRDLDREFVNIGISGEGKMDMVMARALAGMEDVALYLIDPIPNCTEAMCDSLTYDFVNIIRQARPDVPIVMLEGPIYPYARFDSYFRNYLPAKNAAFRRNYERLIAENPDNLYYVDSVNLDGVEDDGTVDGIHLTDLGFKYYAEKLRPVLMEILKNKD